MKSILLCLLLAGTLAQAQQIQDTLQEKNNPAKVISKPKMNIILKSVFGFSYAGATYWCYRSADTPIQDESQEGKNGLKTRVASSVSPLGLGKVNFIGCGATAAFAYLTRNEELQHASVLWMESLLINDQVTSRLKSNFQRYRPNTGLPSFTFDGEDGPNINRSFPSAHTSTAFTTATLFASFYKDKKWVAPLAYGMATMVGLSRVYDNYHWASDVMAGAAIGFLSAKAVIGLDKLLAKKHIQLYPQIGRRRSAVAKVYGF
ncbi:MAG: phosphatase PAP2 family protein [Flavisolibacter sp.]|nr:phosphatase PAP2 family protein [Flavisolibacter sp.]MBD0350151.1 phosphatase PAP2 family protein [Flavisolibacter sp.]